MKEWSNVERLKTLDKPSQLIRLLSSIHWEIFRILSFKTEQKNRKFYSKTKNLVTIHTERISVNDFKRLNKSISSFIFFFFFSSLSILSNVFIFIYTCFIRNSKIILNCPSLFIIDLIFFYLNFSWFSSQLLKQSV